MSWQEIIGFFVKKSNPMKYFAQRHRNNNNKRATFQKIKIRSFQDLMSRKLKQIQESNQEIIDYMEDVMMYFQETFNQMSMKFVQFVTVLHSIKNKNRIRQPQGDPKRNVQRHKQTKRQTITSKIQNMVKAQNDNRIGSNNNKIKKTKSNISNTSNSTIMPHMAHTAHKAHTSQEQEMYSFPLNQEQLLNEDDFNLVDVIPSELPYQLNQRNSEMEEQDSLFKDEFLLSQRQDIKRSHPEARNEQIDKYMNDRWSKMAFYQRKQEIDQLKKKRQLQNSKNLVKKINNQEFRVNTNEKFNNLLTRRIKKEQPYNDCINIESDRPAQEFKIDIRDLREAVNNPSKNLIKNVNEGHMFFHQKMNSLGYDLQGLQEIEEFDLQ